MKWRSPALLFAIGVVVTVVLAVGAVMALVLTSGAIAVSDNAPLIAAVIALGGVGTAQMVSIALEDRRTQESRELEAQRAHEAALRKYFEQVGTLLIEQPLHRASPGDKLSTVVRAQTLTTLEGLDPDRKHILLQFLYESGLIDKDKPVVSLAAANLRGANLRGINLRGANLNMGANLGEANLIRANLEWANLYAANLSCANLNGAYLGGANVMRANLNGANLEWANLNGANLSCANLNGAYLDEANLGGANLDQANLSGANLSGANLNGADLIRSYLNGVNLNGVNLSHANLSGATGWTVEQLSEAESLVGATMPDRTILKSDFNPDGLTFEEWLKSHGEENIGP